MTNDLEFRVRALERRADELEDLVDGQEAWSHRKRLHVLEGNAHAAVLAQEALRAYRETRDSLWTRTREWGSFAIAMSALIYAVVMH